MALDTTELEILSVSAPGGEVAPGGTEAITLEIRVHNRTFEFIGVNGCSHDATPCDGSFLDRAGYCVRAWVRVGGEEYSSNPFCIQLPLIGTNTDVTIQVETTMPTGPGNHTVDAWIETLGDNLESDEHQDSVTVSSDGGGGDGDVFVSSVYDIAATGDEASYKADVKNQSSTTVNADIQWRISWQGFILDIDTVSTSLNPGQTKTLDITTDQFGIGLDPGETTQVNFCADVTGVS